MHPILFEIRGLTPSAAELLEGGEQVDETQERYAGRDWIRVLPEADLPVGGQRLVELPRLDILLVRTERRIHAINNACPHLRLPLLESTVTGDDTIVCRWHESSFDLNTGEIIRWCRALTDDGMVEGSEDLGNLSKNRAPVMPFPVRVHHGYVWVSIE